MGYYQKHTKDPEWTCNNGHTNTKEDWTLDTSSGTSVAECPECEKIHPVAGPISGPLP